MKTLFLEKRVEAPNRALAFNIFRRTDNLYQFRLDRLRAAGEAQEYWLQGDPLSGTYQSAEEAETAVRDSEEWRAAQHEPIAPVKPPARPPLTNFYELRLEADLRSQDIIDWEMSRAADRAGPFIAPHIPTLGIRLTSLGSGFPRDAPPDRIIYKLNPKRRVRDFEHGGAFWVISEPARDVLLRYAADAIDVVPAEVSLRDKAGNDIAIPQRFLCDVIRFEDVVDEAASKIEWGPGRLAYSVGSLLAFKKDLPPNLHLFRIWNWPRTIVCSAELRSALQAANLRGLSFQRLDILEFD